MSGLFALQLLLENRLICVSFYRSTLTSSSASFCGELSESGYSGLCEIVAYIRAPSPLLVSLMKSLVEQKKNPYPLIIGIAPGFALEMSLKL